MRKTRRTLAAAHFTRSDPAAVADARMAPALSTIFTGARLGTGLEVCRHLARLAARFGRIDRRIREVSTGLDV
jgi:hypothetical protein